MRSEAIFSPRTLIVSSPSASSQTAPYACPIPTFQMLDPGMIIWLIKKKWFIEAKAGIDRREVSGVGFGDGGDDAPDRRGGGDGRRLC